MCIAYFVACCFRPCAPRHWCMKIAYLVVVSFFITVLWHYLSSPATYYQAYRLATDPEGADFVSLGKQASRGTFDTIKRNLYFFEEEEEEWGSRERPGR